MSRTLYHVTKAENVTDIWNTGIQPKPPDAHWVAERAEMRAMLDEVGKQIHTDWVSRQNAIFFWATHRSAVRYADKLVEPAIVEVTIDKDCWCLNNTDLELLYDDFRSSEAQDVEDTAETLVKMAGTWHGEMDEGLEVWTEPPVPPANVHQIYNIDGTVFER